MSNQDLRRQIAAELPPNLRYVYTEDPNGTLPDLSHMLLVRDRTKATKILAHSSAFLSGLLQTDATLRYITSVPFPPPLTEATPADRDRLVRFRQDTQAMQKVLPADFIIAHSSITGLPASLRGQQIEHVLTVAQDESPWSVRYIPEGVRLPPYGKENFNVTRTPKGDSAFVEGCDAERSGDGAILAIHAGTVEYLAVGSPEAALYAEHFVALGDLALSPHASIDALARLC
jgi:hypothetical protein